MAIYWERAFLFSWFSSCVALFLMHSLVFVFLSRLVLDHMSRLMTKPTKWLCAQRRLRSAWASAQSDQSLRCPYEKKLGSLATHWAHSEDSAQTGWMPRLIWVFAGRTVILLVLSWGGSYLFLIIAFSFTLSSTGLSPLNIRFISYCAKSIAYGNQIYVHVTKVYLF